MARHFHHKHHAHQLQGRDPAVVAAPAADPEPIHLQALLESPMAQVKSLLARGGYSVDGDSDDSDDSSTSSSSDVSSNSPDDTSSSTSSSSSSISSSGSSSSSSGKDKGGGNNVSLPVALGVIIPIALACIIFFYLHRRHVRRLRQEDANDPHKSLDFGWDPTTQKRTNQRWKSKKGKPEMMATDNLEKSIRKDRGLSLDIDVGSPYLLPPGVHGSRESMHSMSRTIHSQDDKYRPATAYNPNDNLSFHSAKPRRADTSSSHTGSASLKRDDMKQDLLGNAQRMSRSPAAVQVRPVPEIAIPEAAQGMPRKPMPSSPGTPGSAGLSPNAPLLDPRDSYMVGDDLRKSNNYLGAFIHSRDPSADVRSPDSEKTEYATPREMPATPSSFATNENPSLTSPAPASAAEPPRRSRQQSLRSSQQASIEHNFLDDSSDYGDAVKVTPASPRRPQQEQLADTRGSSQEYMPPIDEYSLGVNESEFAYDVRRLSTGVRPLPPDDPTDNPEQRANRIRSFYKEYFDDSKPPQAAPDYYEDYDENYLEDGAIFDPASGQYVTGGAVPYAEPYGRRAMTPPPRGVGRRHAATMSGGSRPMPPGSRAFSSASARFGPGRGPPPKKKLPPPQPLRVLPTPHMLKEDAFTLPIDFAPPGSARERQAGRPDSPRGGSRPFSPAVRPHTPLARSYDDLAVMPSP